MPLPLHKLSILARSGLLLQQSADLLSETQTDCKQCHGKGQGGEMTSENSNQNAPFFLLEGPLTH